VLPVSFVPMTGEAEGKPKPETRNPKEGRSPKSEKDLVR
jgi:hypothetical protein